MSINTLVLLLVLSLVQIQGDLTLRKKARNLPNDEWNVNFEMLLAQILQIYMVKIKCVTKSPIFLQVGLYL